MSEQYKKWNTRLGWIIGIIATIVYLLTAEASGSFWDCGEFVSCAYKLQNPHPPGNAFFTIIGRLFVILFGNSPEHAAFAVNAMSAVSGGATIMFLFWIITHFARKFVLLNHYEKAWQSPLIFCAALLGAGSAIFTDSFWFSTVEGEVYALAACVLMAIVWLMTKWENRANEPHADRYLIFIFLLIGLSTGVHLLDLLVIPVITMIFYFKRFEKKITPRGTLIAFIIGCVITGFAMSFVLGRTVSWGAALDLVFVETLGLPMFSGFTFFIFLLILISFLVVWYAYKKGRHYLRVGALCYLMMLLGYSVYNVSIIRARANVPINMSSPDNPMALNSYISRAQYGDKPLIYGQVFTAGNVVGRDGEAYQPKYEDGATFYESLYDSATHKYKYVEADKEVKETFNPEDMMLFPRVWNNKNDGRNTQDFYANWLGIGKVQDKQTGRELYERAPTFGDNLHWFASYQIGWMYMRYLMWNFSGRQNDIQGLGNARDGNAITGISWIDNSLLGDQSKMPRTIREHASHNTMYALPLLLGFIGLLFYAYRDRNGFITILVFFFFTGLAIMVYLNDAGPQPRERDYASAVSFLVFCVWIGFSVIWLFDMLKKYVIKKTDNLRVPFYVCVAVLFLISPVLMASQEWNDHDRSKKRLASDYARDMLMSCDKNAILFTAGDNDTYPLWYAQEVEGVRTDVRVVNTSLLGIDWYINQLAYKEYESEPFDAIFTPAQVLGNNRNYVLVRRYKNNAEDIVLDLYDVLKNFVASDDNRTRLPLQDGSYIDYFPTRKFTLPTPAGSPSERIVFEFPKGKNGIRKDELAILAIIAASKWKRPVHFASRYDDLGFGNYLQRQGMTYKLVPFVVGVKNAVNKEVSLPLLLNTYKSGGLDKYNLYLDETNRMQALSIRDAYIDVAGALVDEGDTANARKVLHRIDELMPNAHLPYGMVSRYNMHNTTSLRMLQVADRAGDSTLAKQIEIPLRADLEQQITYYDALPLAKQDALYYERDRTKNLLRYLNHITHQKSMVEEEDEDAQEVE